MICHQIIDIFWATQKYDFLSNQFLDCLLQYSEIQGMNLVEIPRYIGSYNSFAFV